MMSFLFQIKNIMVSYHRERNRETDRERDKRERQTETERQRQTEKDTQTKRDKSLQQTLSNILLVQAVM